MNTWPSCFLAAVEEAEVNGGKRKLQVTVPSGLSAWKSNMSDAWNGHLPLDLMENKCSLSPVAEKECHRPGNLSSMEVEPAQDLGAGMSGKGSGIGEGFLAAVWPSAGCHRWEGAHHGLGDPCLKESLKTPPANTISMWVWGLALQHTNCQEPHLDYAYRGLKNADN